jgi:hypothetical protein
MQTNPPPPPPYPPPPSAQVWTEPPPPPAPTRAPPIPPTVQLQTAAADFHALVLAKKNKRRGSIYPLVADEETKQHFALLRNRLETLRTDILLTMPTVELIIRGWAARQMRYYREVAWHDHWKNISHEGYDTRSGKCLDYGNFCYSQVLNALCELSPTLSGVLRWMALNHFGSLQPTLTRGETRHAINMKGDVIEIMMAALRGHDEFTSIQESIFRVTGQTVPQARDRFMRTMQAFHLLHAFCENGAVWYSNTRVYKFSASPEFFPDLDQEFARQWRICPASSFAALLRVGEDDDYI